MGAPSTGGKIIFIRGMGKVFLCTGCKVKNFGGGGGMLGP